MDMAGLVEVTSAAELRELAGTPMARAVAKERTALREIDREWLAASPFCLVATSDAEGRCDVSPKGDPAGFTLVLDERTIVIPDRPGNRRMDGFQNVLVNPHVGLLYVIPGRGDTLRIAGRARLVRDAPFFDRLVVRGHRPTLALVVEIEQVFHHCGKAFMRSELWEPASWHPEALPSTACVTKAVVDTPETVAVLERYYGGEQYAKTLYG
jgi:PPOX class probable FMN-dependent enzyme